MSLPVPDVTARHRAQLRQTRGGSPRSPCRRWSSSPPNRSTCWSTRPSSGTSAAPRWPASPSAAPCSRSPPGSATCSRTARPAGPPAGSAPATVRRRSTEGVQASWLALAAGLVIAVGAQFAGRPGRPGPRRFTPGRGARRRDLAADRRARRARPAARDGRQRLDARRAGHPPAAALRARREPVVGRALPAAGLPGRARPRRAPRSPTSPRRRRSAPCSCARWSANGSRCAPHAGADPRRSSPVGRDLLIRGAAFQVCFLSATAVAARFGAGRARRAPDRAAVVAVLLAAPGRDRDRGAVAGRRGAGRRATRTGPGRWRGRIAASVSSAAWCSGCSIVRGRARAAAAGSAPTRASTRRPRSCGRGSSRCSRSPASCSRSTAC